MAKKFVETETYKTRQYGRIRYKDSRYKKYLMYFRVEKDWYGNWWCVATRGSPEGEVVFSMKLAEWAEFSKLFDEHLANEVGDILEDL